MTFMAQRVQHFGTTIFSEMTLLAQKHQAINLGQGFPDFPAPDFVKEAAHQAIANNINQYAPRNGLPQLRQVLARKIAQHDGWDVDPENIVVVHGATEAIFATIMGVVNPGDEVIVFEPFYDSYLPSIEFAGGIPRFYTLTAPDWGINREQLATLFNDKTKLIIINTPHNPTGKVFSAAELGWIAELCQQHNVVAMVDAVYEHLVFDQAQHHCLATRPGMAERTILISSVGKTFSVTGWKVGWTAASADLTQAIVRGHQFITFCGVSPLQAATAEVITQAEQNGYYADFQGMYTHKRDFLLQALDTAGLRPIAPQGTYFVMAQIDHLDFENDVAFCRYLTSEIGVAAIPPSAFYHNPADGAHLVRFTFCKQDTVLATAAQRLKKLKQ